MAALSGAAASNDPETNVLHRKGDWVANYGSDGCHVYGTFGTGDGEVIARFTRYDLGDDFKLGLFGKPVTMGRVSEDVQIAFGQGKPVAERVLSGMMANRPALFFSGVRLDGWKRPLLTKQLWRAGPRDLGPRTTEAQEAAATGLTLLVPGKPPLRLEAGSLDKPFIVLRDCVDKLVRRWGYDPEVQRHLARRIGELNYPAEWLTDADYPSLALRKHLNAMVHFRLDVDAEGKITGCQVLDKTEPAEFGNVTCNTISRRAKLAPALDSNMKPVPSFVVHTFNWRTGDESRKR